MEALSLNLPMRAPFLWQGGGFYIVGGDVVLTSCNIFANTAASGPGILHERGGTICIFDVPYVPYVPEQDANVFTIPNVACSPPLSLPPSHSPSGSPFSISR